MSHLGKFIAAHPLAGSPYDKLRYARLDKRRVPLYTVASCGDHESGAYDALGRAFAKFGGECFYCAEQLTGGKLSSSGPHRDHVIAQSKGRNDLLHNLVIACGKCGAKKGRKPIEEFQPEAAGKYLEALNRHLSICLRRKFPTDA